VHGHRSPEGYGANIHTCLPRPHHTRECHEYGERHDRFGRSGAFRQLLGLREHTGDGRWFFLERYKLFKCFVSVFRRELGKFGEFRILRLKRQLQHILCFECPVVRELFLFAFFFLFFQQCQAVRQ